MKYKCRKHFGRNKTTDTSQSVCYLSRHMQTRQPWVSRQKPNLCLLSMSVSTKVKFCPTWLWETLGDKTRDTCCARSQKPHKCLKRKHTFKKQHNKTQLDVTGPERRPHSKRKTPHELNLQSSSKSDVTYFEYDWYKRKKQWKAFPTPR